ncbi:hypothetical protein BDA99DRAFT_23049 [Phascolomyces articulosus]|uniref:Uncharacterized protein n=1 Tax=Phascolomyces articulosus TaxID=60185 RepID=A0AAD5PFD8_9FUNG|nr:hypothetical protein BDA99DRAFT_23049 [Phascolomyces articulosus]
MPRHERLQHQRSTGNILNRMRHNVRKILLIHKRNPNNNENNSNNNNNNNNDNDDIRRNQTVNKKRDWRTLSPECPPLPSVDLSPPNGDTILSNTAHLNNSNGAEHLTSLTDNKVRSHYFVIIIIIMLSINSLYTNYYYYYLRAKEYKKKEGCILFILYNIILYGNFFSWVKGGCCYVHMYMYAFLSITTTTLGSGLYIYYTI